jgi:hypothetical protein
VAERVIDVSSKIRLHCPLAPAQLCVEWVNEAQRVVGSRRSWSSLRLNGQILINTATSGFIDVTRGSNVVAAGVNPGTLFLQSEVGRQLRGGPASPVYTILEVDPVADQAIIDQPWGPDSAVQLATTILDAYATMPKNFNNFMAVIDPVNNWQLHWYITEAQLNRWDAKRTSTTTPWAVVSHDLSNVPGFIGQPRYEVWPYSTAKKYYTYMARLHPQTLGLLDEIQGPLGFRSDILLLYCLYKAASWPGLSFDNKNIYFSPTLALSMKKEFESELWILEQRDDDVFPVLRESTNWQNLPWAPLDSRFMQEHDAVGMGLVGGGYF